MVYNKIDLTTFSPQAETGECGNIARVWISAKNGQGLDLLRNALVQVADTFNKPGHAVRVDSDPVAVV